MTAVLVLVVCGADAFAQTRTGARASGGADSTTSVRGDGQSLDIASGTRLSAQLESALDVNKARVGDRVVLKTTEAIRSGGRIVVDKGARLVGSVTAVQRRTQGAAESSISLVFDRLERGKLSAPITATINSVTQASATARTRGRDDDEGDFGAGAGGSASGRAQTSGRSGSSGSGGGLLGGVTGAVGGVAETTTRAAGDVVGGTTDAAGRTVGGVGQTLRGVRVTQTLGASVEGSSTLSLTGGNLRLEKGTRFNLTLSESAEVGRQ